MYLLGLGLILLILKYMQVAPVAAWSWWWVLIPFALAVAWWAWADSSGYTKRKAMDKDDARRDARRQKSLESLGLGPKKKKR